MHFTAISVGDAVPRVDFDAVVHSVFQSAINLRPSGKSELLTLVTSSEADLPQGIRVDTPNDFSFETFHVGEQLTCRDDSLRLDSLTVELRGARRWKCDLSALEVDTAKPTVSAAWSCVWDAVNKHQVLSDSEIVTKDLFHSNGSMDRIVSRKASEAVHELVNATRRYELTNTSTVNALIGLGPGLTPSGDDLLVGYMAGLWCTVQNKSERIQFVSDLTEAVTHHSQQTNDISRTYLYHAIRGQVSSRLVNLAEAISRGENPERLLGIAGAAMRVGHNSGMVAVAGLLLGLVVWNGDYL